MKIIIIIIVNILFEYFKYITKFIEKNLKKLLI